MRTLVSALTFSTACLLGDFVGSQCLGPTREPPLAKTDWVGIYKISAGGDKGYVGTVAITKEGQVYQFDCVTERSHSYGVGMESGDVLAVGWHQVSEKIPKGITGLTILRKKSEGIVGTWASIPGGTQTNREDYVKGKFDEK